MSVTSAGILPYAYFNNTIYFLLGREHKQNGWSGSGKLADFGGAVESDHKSSSTLAEFGTVLAEYPRVAAAIEFWEETMGLFYTKKEAFDLLKKQNGIVVQNGGYAEHLMQVDYNPYWVELFTNGWNYVLSCAVLFTGNESGKKEAGGKAGVAYHIPSCPDGYTEKTEIKWIKYDDLKAQVDSGSSGEYRPELVNTLKLVFKHDDFKKLLDEASIFKNPETKGFVAPVVPEPILPKVAPNAGAVEVVLKPTTKTATTKKGEWPSFYPNKTQIVPGLITSMQSRYSYLLSYLPLSKENPKMIGILTTIDKINIYHRDLKKFLYLKTVPGAGTAGEASIIPKAYWKNKYCPLGDKNVSTTMLGQGAYGQAYLATATEDVPQQLKYVVKLIVGTSVQESELTDLGLDVAKVKDLVPTKKSNIVVTEIASLACVNHLVTYSHCYNFPYFYGVSKCQDDGQHYMYMQASGANFKSTGFSNGDEYDAVVLQALMGMRAMYDIELVHGDINLFNLTFQKTQSSRQPLYFYDDKWYTAGKSQYVLHYIDFGMGFIKDKLEPTTRLEKDKGRVNNNVNWKNDASLKAGKAAAYEAYKGYYVESKDKEDAAYLRRHLLDLYLFFDTMQHKGPVSITAKYASIRDYFMPFFLNPYYYSKNWSLIDPLSSIKPTNRVDAMKAIWSNIYIKLIDLKTTFAIVTEDTISSNPDNYMFLGNLDAPLNV